MKHDIFSKYPADSLEFPQRALLTAWSAIFPILTRKVRFRVPPSGSTTGRWRRSLKRNPCKSDSNASLWRKRSLIRRNRGRFSVIGKNINGGAPPALFVGHGLVTISDTGRFNRCIKMHTNRDVAAS